MSVDNAELFELELGTKGSTSETKTFNVFIQEFTRKIDIIKTKKQAINTPEFKIVGKKMSISVYPVIRQDNDTGIGVYLNNENNEEIIVSFTATLMGEEISRKRKLRNAKINAGSACGFPRFFTQEEYNNLAKEDGDIFQLEVKVKLHFSQNTRVWTEICEPKIELNHLGLALAKCNLREDKILTDFTVVSQEGTRFPCHRLFLATQSPVMMAMMTHNMKEKQEGELKLEHSEEVVKHFLDFFYTGQVPPNVLEENVESFLTLAEFYDLKSLKFQTEEAAIEKMTGENMIHMFALADLYKSKELKRESEFLIKTNKNILKNQDLSEVPANVMTEVVRLLC